MGRARTVRYTGNCEQIFPKSAISELNNHGILQANISKKRGKVRVKLSSQEII